MFVFYGCSVLFSQLKFIVDDASKQPAGPGLGSLTAENRTVWAKVILLIIFGIYTRCQ